MSAKRATKTLITSINRYGKNKKKEQDDYKQIANCIKDENSGHVTIPVNIYMQISSTIEQLDVASNLLEVISRRGFIIILKLLREC